MAVGEVVCPCPSLNVTVGVTPLPLEVAEKLPHELLESILNQVRDGCENLDILCWVHNTQLPIAPVMEVLEAIDINRQRLLPPAE